MLKKELLDAWFDVRMPSANQLFYFERISKSAKNLVKIIDKLVPDCADKSVAFRKIREATLDAFNAICIKEK